jgi:replicative DNA helicase
MSTAALCHEVRKHRVTIEMKQNLQLALEMADKDPQKAAAITQRGATDALNLYGGNVGDVYFTSALDKIISNYELREQGVDLSVAKFPWEVLNEATGGITDEDYIVFYGRPKSMKSWVLAYLIAWLFHSDRRVLIYTKEMSAENIFMRVAACIAEIEYQGLRVGRLSSADKHSLYTIRRMLSVIKKDERLICLSGNEQREGADTVPWLQSKVEKYKPSFVCIDGMYLMSDIRNAKKDHERVRNISRDTRQMVLNTRVPVFATVQANRAAAKHTEANLDEVAFSDAFSQDPTLIVRVINEKGSPTIALVIGGAREFDLNGFRINAVPATDFSYHGPLSAKDIERAKVADAKAEDDNPESHVRKRKAKKPTESSAGKEAEKIIDKTLH